jgi:hypothetical protein
VFFILAGKYFMIYRVICQTFCHMDHFDVYTRIIN